MKLQINLNIKNIFNIFYYFMNDYNKKMTKLRIIIKI